MFIFVTGCLLTRTLLPPSDLVSEESRFPTFTLRFDLPLIAGYIDVACYILDPSVELRLFFLRFGKFVLLPGFNEFIIESPGR